MMVAWKICAEEVLIFFSTVGISNGSHFKSAVPYKEISLERSENNTTINCGWDSSQAKLENNLLLGSEKIY